MVWLWKDHTSYAEAEQITETAAKHRPQYLAKIGGVYSSEWYWSKILHCKNTEPEVFEAADSWVEICDWIPAVLIGELTPKKIKRSVCAAGHKAMFNQAWQGLPDENFLDNISPGLGALRSRLYAEAYTSDTPAGNLSEEWSETLGLPRAVAVAVGAFDAHMGAVGAGISTGTLVKDYRDEHMRYYDPSAQGKAQRYSGRLRDRRWVCHGRVLRHRGGTIRSGRYFSLVHQQPCS